MAPVGPQQTGQAPIPGTRQAAKASRSGPGTNNARGDPQGTVACGRTKGLNLEHEFDFLPTKGAQIHIGLVVLAVIDLADAPEPKNGAIANLVVEAEEHQAGAGAALTVHNRLEAVAGLDGKGRVNALDVAIPNVVREGQQARQGQDGAIFELGIEHPQDKPTTIAIAARAGQRTRRAGPGSRAGISKQVVGRAFERSGIDVDIDPDWAIPGITSTKDLARWVAEHP